MQFLIVADLGHGTQAAAAICAFKNIPVNTESAVSGNTCGLDIASVSFQLFFLS